MQPLILASTSPFRRELLQKLRLPFLCAAPAIDESAIAGESATALVERLARAKAEAVATAHPDGLIIGSDQVATLGESVLGKPGDHATALQQLTACQGQKVVFQTALALLNGRTGQIQSQVVPFTVYFRQLPIAQLERYLALEQPYQCAGSFKSEGLGIALFSKLEGEDPNTLIGLPLIALIAMLEREGVSPL
ncbi:septum formation inhibitor Maf [Ectothiorhodospiraceae bacterium BW-2]|nr:septum formation inhibitor Maf [Ectothiorhodospiraceae bacterium BW-2]